MVWGCRNRLATAGTANADSSLYDDSPNDAPTYSSRLILQPLFSVSVAEQLKVGLFRDIRFQLLYLSVHPGKLLSPFPGLYSRVILGDFPFKLIRARFVHQTAYPRRTSFKSSLFGIYGLMPLSQVVFHEVAQPVTKAFIYVDGFDWFPQHLSKHFLPDILSLAPRQIASPEKRRSWITKLDWLVLPAASGVISQ